MCKPVAIINRHCLVSKQQNLLEQLALALGKLRTPFAPVLILVHPYNIHITLVAFGSKLSIVAIHFKPLSSVDCAWDVKSV